jgi:hypothetical protein
MINTFQFHYFFFLEQKLAVSILKKIMLCSSTLVESQESLFKNYTLATPGTQLINSAI